MKILTKDGFKNFKGLINNGTPKELIRLSFSNGETLKCTPCHELLMEDRETYLPAAFIELDDILSTGVSIIDKENAKPEIVYDFLEVEDTHSYTTNGVESHNCIFLDEFAFVNDASTFYTSTYPVISSGDDTKVIITSTPNGIGNQFYTMWQKAVNGTSEYKPFTIKWWDVPGRDEAWKALTISNTSELQFSQEYSCLGGDSKVKALINNHEVDITLRNLHETYPLLNNPG